MHCDLCKRQSCETVLHLVADLGRVLICCVDESECLLVRVGPEVAARIGMEVAVQLRQPLAAGVVESVSRCGGGCGRTVSVTLLEDGVFWLCHQRQRERGSGCT